MNYKRLTLSLATLVAVGTIVAGGTIAYYSDTETSEGNVFTAGNVDLKVDHTRQTYNGVDCQTCSVLIYSDSSNQVVAKDGDDSIDPFAAVYPDEHADDWADEFGNAKWIWGEEERPAPEDDTSYTFEKTFDWWGPVADVTLTMEIAADDDYEVLLNGDPVADDTDAWQGTEVITLDADDIVQGENTLQFVVENSGGWYAGLLYELEITRENCEEGVGDFQSACMLWNETDLDDSHKFWTFGDIKPGDWGTNVVSLHVYDNDAYLCLEAFDEDGAETEDGNIGNYINVLSWLDKEGTGEFNQEDGDVELGTNALGQGGTLASLEPGDDHGEYLAGTSTEYVTLAWCAGDISLDEGNISCDGSSVSNDAQGTSFYAGLMAYVEQTRNNDEFSCAERAQVPVTQD